ncbi:MAG: hypothetical protein ACM3ZC_04325 [Bacteroidota bacterium]
MICPKCKTEYREGFFLCLDCGEELVTELPPEKPVDPAAYVPLLAVNSRMEYEILRAHFDAAGIEYLPGGNLIERLRFPVAVGVRADQFEMAGSLLEDIDLANGETEATEEGYEREVADAPVPVLGPESRPAATALGVVVEGAVAREGRFLAIAPEDTDDGAVSLPGGPVTPLNGETEGVLEAALRRILAEEYGVEVAGEMLYVGNRLRLDAAGRASLGILFLAHWRFGEPTAESVKWLDAAEIERLPGAEPGLCEGVQRADRIRVDRGW